MKRIAFIILLFISPFVFGYGMPLSEDKISKLYLPISFCCKTNFELFQLSAYQKQQCCVSHEGVCGCHRGRVVCCDGSYSPSCGCKN